MNNNEISQVRALISEGFTFVGVCGEKIKTSTERGVKPLLSLIDAKESLEGFYCADKVVGKGAAHLYVLLKPEHLYAEVISAPALDLLVKNNVSVEYGTVCDEIKNRSKTGRCPIESATLDIDDSTRALEAIRITLDNLLKNIT